MNKSISIAKLADALSKAQAEMPVVKMNASNPFLKNKYADLGAVIETSRPILAKNGLSISQFPTSEGDKLGITSILMHTSGEWLENTIDISPTDSKGLSYAQAAGVVISYLRRYGWASILGLYADEDIDGHVEKKVDDTIISNDLWKRYTEVFTKAKKLGVNATSLERAKSTRQEVETHGKELKSAIEAIVAQEKAGQ